MFRDEKVGWWVYVYIPHTYKPIISEQEHYVMFKIVGWWVFSYI